MFSDFDVTLLERGHITQQFSQWNCVLGVFVSFVEFKKVITGIPHQSDFNKAILELNKQIETFSVY